MRAAMNAEKSRLDEVYKTALEKLLHRYRQYKINTRIV